MLYLLISRLQLWPNLVDIRSAGFLLFLFLPGLPAADAKEAEHVHLVNLPHAPAAFQKGIVGGIDKIRQLSGHNLGHFSKLPENSRISVDFAPISAIIQLERKTPERL